jgi:hypothetical protein
MQSVPSPDLQKRFLFISFDMKPSPVLVCLIFLFCAMWANGQSLVVVNEPGARPVQPALTAAEKNLMQRSVLPKVRKILASDTCSESDYQLVSTIKGSFTKPGAQQTLVYYQYCVTGNGLGSTGVAVLENGKVVASYIAEDGDEASGARSLPDIDQDGVNEVVLEVSGGMHQGSGGTGAELVEFASAGIKSLGWFTQDEFSENGPSIAYRVTAKRGKPPLFYRQKFTSRNEKKWNPAGKPLPFKLGKPLISFAPVR